LLPVAELVSLAADLRGLPREDFKARLKSDLERGALTMIEEEMISDDVVLEPEIDQIRATFRTVTPYLTVPDVFEEIEFVTRVFGAVGKVYGLGSAGGYHSEYSIGGSMVMIGGGGEGSKWRGTPAPASLHLYVEDVDAVYQRAMAAGARSLSAPVDQPYGDREAGVEDPGGNQWYIATHQGANFAPAGAPNLMAYLHPKGAPAMIELLKQAFAAEATAIHQSSDGIVRHATISIGTSMVEMGEAHGQWQPMPMTFMLYVDDVDAWYARAMKAEGMISITNPSDLAYGDRVGAVKDPFENTWYIGTHLQTKKSETNETGRTSMAAPKLFRIVVQVSDLDRASAFDAKLLVDPGRRIPRGSRHYFDCGAVILALVDVTAGHLEPKPIPDYVYFAVSNLDEVFARAQEMDCLAKEDVHGEDAGEATVVRVRRFDRPLCRCTARAASAPAHTPQQALAFGKS
jgi:PhnB protein